MFVFRYNRKMFAEMENICFLYREYTDKSIEYEFNLEKKNTGYGPLHRYNLNIKCNARKIESSWYNFCVRKPECIRPIMINTLSFSGLSSLLSARMPRSSLPVPKQTASPSILTTHLWSWTVKLFEWQVLLLYVPLFVARVFCLALHFVLFVVIIGLHF